MLPALLWEPKELSHNLETRGVRGGWEVRRSRVCPIGLWDSVGVGMISKERIMGPKYDWKKFLE